VISHELGKDRGIFNFLPINTTAVSPILDVGVSSDMIVKTSVFGKNKEVNVNDFYAT
jgi:hypothetical protein